MRGIGAACTASGSLIRGAVCRGVVSATAVCANLVFFAVGTDVPKFLAVVASDWLMDVFKYRDGVAVNENLL